MFFKSLDRWLEVYLTIASISTCVWLGVIFSILRSGFDYGCAGYLVVFLFVYLLIPLCTTYFVIFSICAWVNFNLFEVVANNARPGMLLVTNLLIGTSIVLAMISVFAKEYSARQQFRTMNALNHARTTVGELERSNRALIKTARQFINSSGASFLISYRRADSEAITGRIRDRLAGHFGDTSIFMDIDNIPFGLDFREQLSLAARSAKILLVVIGPNWIAHSAEGHSRILDPNDPVRVEVETAFKSNIVIIPVLVSGATHAPTNYRRR